ncbi:hypothetical protein EII29_02220 [Leptotrichia sp. OH3620_COT-345]|uniref:WlaTC/HtrL family glycosyltransferase n=1 Tax=Leptotrichia sp. OH3620_COT-345 TaxID=2491048 RepID=UPI000F64E43F|nr:WlaTC/HtrL family glycosyltransferase [Leptotrichia sp. OH3620_COT-345]RRD40771.1 hypothetical protein EII29_02220 [Leptotrichia sp. OH3620_COT-345]
MEKGTSISIVTAFFNIGRGEIGDNYPDYLKRTTETYFEYFFNLAKLDNEMIIFTSKEYKEKVLEIRKGKPTKVVVLDFYKKFRKQIKLVKSIQESQKFKSGINKDMIKNIEYWSPEYTVVTNLKIFFVNYAIRKNLVNSKIVSWIDFGYVRNEETLGNIKKWEYPFETDKVHFFTLRKKFSLEKIEDVYDVIFNNKVFIIGGAAVSGKENWKNFYKLLRKEQNELLKSDIIDDDQGIYMMCLFKYKKFIKLHYLGKDRWFFLFRKYDVTSKIGIIERLRDIIK